MVKFVQNKMFYSRQEEIMRRLRDHALRTRLVLVRETQPLTEECREVIAQDLARTLGEYFELAGDVSLKVTRGETITISVEAHAFSVLPFGVVRGGGS